MENQSVNKFVVSHDEFSRFTQASNWIEVCKDKYLTPEGKRMKVEWGEDGVEFSEIDHIYCELPQS